MNDFWIPSTPEDLIDRLKEVLERDELFKNQHPIEWLEIQRLSNNRARTYFRDEFRPLGIRWNLHDEPTFVRGRRAVEASISLVNVAGIRVTETEKPKEWDPDGNY